MKRVWKPLDVGGLRLYQVERMIQWKGGRIEKDVLLVVTDSPSKARQLVEDCYKKTEWHPSIISVDYFGIAVNVLMPETWWRDGVPCVHDLEVNDGR